MTGWLYLTQSIPLGIAGLVVGGVVGFCTGWVMATASNGKETTMTDTPRRALRARVTGVQVLGLVVLLLAGLSAVQSYSQGRATAEIALCQQSYSNGFADALDARTMANSEAQQALDDLMSTVGEVLTSADPAAGERMTAAVREYLAKRVEAKRTQAANPYPPAPRDACKQQEDR